MIFKLIYIPWIIGILIAGYFLLKAIIRIIKGIISFRKLGKKEFMIRLKDGFDSITPTQRAVGEIRGIVISLIGMILGIIIMAIFRIEHIWFWVEFSLIGGTIITVFQLIGKIQQYRILRRQDKIMEDLELDD